MSALGRKRTLARTQTPRSPAAASSSAARLTVSTTKPADQWISFRFSPRGHRLDPCVDRAEPGFSRLYPAPVMGRCPDVAPTPGDLFPTLEHAGELHAGPPKSRPAPPRFETAARTCKQRRVDAQLPVSLTNGPITAVNVVLTSKAVDRRHAVIAQNDE